MTADEYVANAPAGVREVLQDGMQMLANERVQLVNIIKANARNSFTDQQLSAMGMSELRSIAALARAEETSETNRVPVYMGQSTPATNAGTNEEPLPLPVMNFAKKAG